MHKFGFPLKIQNDWPPVSVEWLWFVPTADGMKLQSCPLFVSELSVGDEIIVELDEDSCVRKWHHRERSHRSTVWVLRVSSTADPAHLAPLRELACNTSWSSQVGVASVDVPPEVDISRFDEVIESLRSSGWAIAYPSWRLEE